MIGSKILNSIRKVQNTWFEQISKHLGDIMRWGEAARRRAVSDELTGLYNRRFLEESAGNRFLQGTLGLRNVSLMMMDLDKIHEINENYGTKAGDLVFISTAEVLRSTTRAGDICARLSGDEFAVLLPDAGTEEAILIAERARENIAARKVSVPIKPDSAEETAISVCTSIGVATAPIHADNWGNLLLAADRALNRAKSLGRNKVVAAG
jgi:diguanylate cyclase (GGDEF)-like protein